MVRCVKKKLQLFNMSNNADHNFQIYDKNNNSYNGPKF